MGLCFKKLPLRPGVQRARVQVPVAVVLQKEAGAQTSAAASGGALAWAGLREMPKPGVIGLRDQLEVESEDEGGIKNF